MTRPATSSIPEPAAHHRALRDRLDDLAACVATALDRGALEVAWSRTRALEREAAPDAPVAAATPIPPAPVIGRRFAAAHARLLRAAESQRRAPRHSVA